ncbi:MAG: OmpH family outer membrane protein [Deltaproteobacteria bacterium]|jgi:outer membrane protein|nr:OmpH family outer membrane protein [Deltaproteobacteria bacterium]
MRKKIVYPVLLLAAMALFLCPLLVREAAAAGQFKIAYIDLQKVMALSDQGKQARQQLEKKRAELGKQIKEKEAKLNKMKEELQRQGMMLSEKARAEKENEYQKQVRDFKLFISDSEGELKKTYKELTKGILQDLEKVIVKVGKEGKYSMILGRQESSIFYADESYDISQQVIDAYNKWKKQQQAAAGKAKKK